MINKITLITIAIAIIGFTSCKNNNDKKTQTNEQKKIAIKVKVKEAKTQDFNHYIKVSGNVEAEQYAFISPQANGQITKIYVNEGDYVKKGDLLIQLNDNIIRNTISEVENSLNLATITFKKQENLWKQKIGSEIQYLQAKTQKESLEKKIKTLNSQLALTQIRAPFSGYVDNIVLKEGELASPGIRVLELVNLKKMLIKADISEKYLSKINKGDTVKITFPDFPNIVKYAQISRIGKIVNPNNRAFKIEVKFNNYDEKIKPNIIASLKIRDQLIKNAIAVPSIIIKNDFEKKFIFVAKKQGNSYIAKKIIVETGISYKDKTVITKGLNIGDKYIYEGFNLVTDGFNVQIVK